MSFAIPDIDWSDVGKNVTRAPQILRKHVDELWASGNNNRNQETLQSTQGQSSSQLSRSKEIIKSYDTLNKNVQKYNTAIIQYVKHMDAIITLFETILEREEVSNIVRNIQDQIIHLQKQFAVKMDAYLDTLHDILKPFAKIIKEREYVQLDVDHYSTELAKINNLQNSDLPEKTLKRKFDYQEKVKDATSKADHLDGFLKMELPLFFQLSNALSQCFATVIFYHVHNVAKIMYEGFKLLEGKFPDLQFNNLYFEHFGNHVKKIQAEMCDSINELNIFKHKSSIYSADITTAPCKVGTALYSYTGERNTDLSFEKGSRVRVVAEDPSGWWRGVLLGSVPEQSGLFPYNYFAFSEER